MVACPVFGRALRADAGHGLPPDLARVPRSGLFPALGRTLCRLERGAARRGRVGARGLGGRGQRRRAGGRCPAPRPSAPEAADHHHHPDRLGPRARAVGRCGAARLRALRPARRGRPLPGALPARRGPGDGNRTVAQPAAGLPRPRHPQLHPQRAAVGALAARLPRAGAADPPRGGQRAPHRRPVRRRRQALRAPGRLARGHRRHRQPQVRYRRAAGPGRAGDAVRPPGRRAAGVDRRQHPSGRGGPGGGPPPPAAGALPRAAAAVGAAPSRTLRARGRAGPGRRLAGRPAQRRRLAACGRCGVRARHAGRADGLLRLRAGGLRRRQPAGHRRPQPARAGRGRHRDGHWPASAQLRGDLAPPAGGRCAGNRPQCRGGRHAAGGPAGRRAAARADGPGRPPAGRTRPRRT